MLTAQREKLQTEYESELNLCQRFGAVLNINIIICPSLLSPLYSYKTNPALGDAHDVEVEMTYMRNVIREKECEMKEVAGKVSTTTTINNKKLNNNNNNKYNNNSFL